AQAVEEAQDVRRNRSTTGDSHAQPSTERRTHLVEDELVEEVAHLGTRLARQSKLEERLPEPDAIQHLAHALLRLGRAVVDLLPDGLYRAEDGRAEYAELRLHLRDRRERDGHAVPDAHAHAVDALENVRQRQVAENEVLLGHAQTHTRHRAHLV